jgi:ABC-type multidrug transport system permease subunit
MKLYNILAKDIKTISRNWVYFAVLFVIPLALVLVSSIMLNSNKLENVRIGFVLNQETQDLQFGIGKIFYYGSIQECIYEMSNSEVSVCIEVLGSGKDRVANVYLDNTKRIVSFYVRQVVLNTLFSQQTEQIQANSDTINSKLTIYSNSIAQAKTELRNTEDDLNDQEVLLITYKNNLVIQRQKFDTAYYQIKSLQPRIKELRTSIANNQNTLTSNINYIRSQTSIIRQSLNDISILLPSNSTPAIRTKVNSALVAVTNIDNTLNNIQSSYPTSETIQILDQIDSSISQLDSAKNSLDQIARDIDTSIEKIRITKNRVATFRNRLNDADNQILELKNITSDKGIATNFIDAFPSSNDFVLFAFPFVVSIVVTFTSLVLSNRFTVVQINHPSYLREIIAPTKDIVFVIADYLINLFFVFIQSMVLVAISIFYFGVSTDQIPPFLFAIFLTSSVFIFVGISLAYLIKNESLSVLTTLFLVMFTFIFSDILVPSILSGVLVRLFINLNPFVMLNNLLIGIILLNKTYSDFIPVFFKLGIMVVSTFLIAYLSKKASKENAIQ